MPFLTTQDPRAKIKGSRDPLGLVPLWYVPARQLVGNLTTATASLRGFTHTLIGRWYGERLVHEERIDEADVLDVFLRFEQIAGYVRFAGHGVADDTRGIERIKRNHDEGKGRVPIGTNRSGRILSDQKVYGLWGLYSVATRVSGLLLDGPVGLTPPARQFVESNYGETLRRFDDKLLPLVQRGGKLPTRRNAKVFAALCDVLPKVPTAQERDWYAEWIRDGLHVADLPPHRQQIVADLLARHTDRSVRITREDVARLRDHTPPGHDGLRRAFQDVLDLESLLVPADLAFDYVQTLDGETPATAAHRLRDAWGVRVPYVDGKSLEDLIPRVTRGASEDLAATIGRVGAAFAASDYEAVVRGLLDWNAHVMRARQAAPWVALDDLGRIEVHYSGRERLLPDGDALAERWHNSYFLNSLAAISRQLDGEL